MVRKYNSPVDKNKIRKYWDSKKNDNKFLLINIKSNISYWLTCDYGHSVKTRITRFLNNGCSICNKQNRSIKITKDYFKRNPSLKKYLSSKNPMSKILSLPSTSNLWWVCKKRGCSNIFLASRNDRARNDSRKRELCSKCSEKKRVSKLSTNVVKKRGSLYDLFPEISEEWHKNKNKGITPRDVTPGNNKKVWWVCPIGHEYESKISNRTQLGRGCPYCRDFGTSLLEKRLLSEFNNKKKIFLSREKICGYEADLFNKELSLIIEVDGHPWHESEKKIAIDIHKNKIWKLNGYEVVRLRDKKLSKKFQKSITFEEKGELNHLEIIIKLNSYLVNKFPKYKHFQSLEKLYSKKGQLVNISGYERMKKTLVSKSSDILTKASPQISSEWNHKKNYPMTPDRISRASDFKAHWICSKCNHHWVARVANRTLLNRGCPVCSRVRTQIGWRKKYLANNNNLKKKYPVKAKAWHPFKNGEKPSSIIPLSNKKAWWLCPNCKKEFEQKICDRVRSSYKWCHFCKT